MNRMAWTNRFIGILLLLLGWAGIGGGVWQILSPVHPRGLDKTAVLAKTRAACEESLKALSIGYSGQTSLTIAEAGLNDPYGSLARASLILLSCPGYELETFCLGTGCELSGMKMTIKPKDAAPPKP